MLLVGYLGTHCCTQYERKSSTPRQKCSIWRRRLATVYYDVRLPLTAGYAEDSKLTVIINWSTKDSWYLDPAFHSPRSPLQRGTIYSHTVLTRKKKMLAHGQTMYNIVKRQAFSFPCLQRSTADCLHLSKVRTQLFGDDILSNILWLTSHTRSVVFFLLDLPMFRFNPEADGHKAVENARK